MRKNELVGSSAVFLEAVREASLLASSDLPVLITGESGVGKERFANYVHARSIRSKETFITLDCCGLSETLFESELFGHEAGAFTDAQKKKQGLFELADNGTLFLDEIGEISPTLQAKLLRVIETGTYRRVGGTQTLNANVRIVSATNCDLVEMVKEGRFRRDLYYRLAGHTLRLPALRDRSGDISQLMCHFMQQQKYKTAPTADALRLLEKYNYPGNIRELKYIIELASLKAGTGNIQPEHMPFCVQEYSASLPDTEERYSRAPDSSQSTRDDHPVGRRKEDREIMGMDANAVLEILKNVKGSRRNAAKELGISERKIYRLIKKYEDAGFEVPPPYL
jgi:two-component system NtrC family response regulator